MGGRDRAGDAYADAASGSPTADRRSHARSARRTDSARGARAERPPLAFAQKLDEVARDVLLVRLDGAAANFHQLGVAPELLDAILGAVAVAAEDLHRGVGDFLGGGGCEQLDRVGAEPIAPGWRDGAGD